MLLIEDKREGFVVSKNNYTGWTHSIMCGTKSIYSKLTFEEIQAKNPEEELEVIYSFDEYYDRYAKPYELRLQEEWQEISEDFYYEALECLPPRRWRKIASDIECFACSECYTMSLHSFYLNVTTPDGPKYYSALRSIFEKDETIAENFQKQFSN